MTDPIANMDKARQRGGQATARTTRKRGYPEGGATYGVRGQHTKYKQQWCFRCNEAHDYHEAKP